MSIHSISSIETVLAQMRQVAHNAGLHAPSSRPALAAPDSGSFAAELARSLKRVSNVQNMAHAQAQAFEMGTPGVALNDVMIDMQKASIAFQTTVQVRNRLVAAYQEIANMAV